MRAYSAAIVGISLLVTSAILSPNANSTLGGQVQPSSSRPATASSPAAEDLFPSTAKPVRAPFMKAGTLLAWVHCSYLVDNQAQAWLKQFNIDGTLLLSIGRPYEPFLRLATVENRTLTPIAWPGDLEDHVEITSPEEALGFLRLFSGPTTWYRFPHFGWLEVRRRTDARPPQDGDMQKEEFDRLNLMTPQVIAYGDGFRVLRPVARMVEGDASEVCIVDETVSRNGRYRVQILVNYRLKDGDVVYASGLRKM
jgi:hypothetical protein